MSLTTHRQPATLSPPATPNTSAQVQTRPGAEGPCPGAWRPGPFAHHRLDAFAVAKQALVEGDRLARRLPRGYGSLSDQLRRALVSAYLGVAESASRTGADRTARFRCARGEASEAAAALDAATALGLVDAAQAQGVITLCARLCAMLTRLGGISA